ncbi:hypothetical protein VTN49DRAFT_4964 [Thermomyces lanuginosus]|uniref:uncharacterized protein n=1 Tax=Thermomyces lanuginosus TaxID=5541 RepID=UPI00374396FD
MSRPQASGESVIPPTQNTAPVHKFECLFTYDLRRKAKRWQDGFLKFHTFNRRIMVYDEAGNFVGDHHWRESHDLDDGDEVELDKGVLVQVSQRVETTHADISTLFEKRKAASESSPAATRASIPPSSASPAGARAAPKSLNAVLGIKRPTSAVSGRPATPKSPNLQRPYRAQHSINPSESDTERPTKRTKREEPVQTPRRSSRLSKQDPPNVINLVDGSDSASEPPQSTPRRSKRLADKTPTPKQPAKQAQNARPASVETKSPRGRLRLLRERREKLMYKPPTPSKTQRKKEPPKEKEEPSSPSSNADFGISDGTQEILDDLARTTSAVRTRIARSSAAANDKEKPLYRIPSHSQVYGSLASSAGRVLNGEHEDSPSPPPPRPPAVPRQRKTPASLLRSRSEVVPATAAPSPPLVLISSSPPASSPSPPPETWPPDWEFVSESPSPPPPSNQAQPARSPGAATKRGERKVLRKALSDTTALRSVESNSHHHRHEPRGPVATTGPPKKQEESDDQGPWTCEAYDFFDFRPPAREKKG